MSDKYGTWTVAELKVELRKRNTKTTDRKEALIERLVAYDRNNNFRNMEEEEEIIVYKPWPSEIYFESVDLKCETPQLDIGEILEANCECVAGKGIKAVCKHVATVAYAVLHFKEHKKLCIRTTCTSNKQMWRVPKKCKLDISPKKSEDISFAIPEYNVQKKAKSNLCFDPRQDRFKNMPSLNDNVRNTVINFNSGLKRTLAFSGTFTAANVTGIISDHDYIHKSLEYQLIYNRIQMLTDAEVGGRS